MCNISIHTLYTESDVDINDGLISLSISIHTLYTESDKIYGFRRGMSVFQSTLSIQRVTGYGEAMYETVVISIHTLYTESDPLLSDFG